MIERSFVRVDGPPGSGKTTFIEHLLRATDRSVHAVRCLQQPGLAAPRESSPSGHPELARYRAAGADGATVYRFSDPEDIESFYVSEIMMDACDVVLEGPRPVGHVELEVFIAPAPGPRKHLLRLAKRNLARERRAAHTRIRSLLKSEGGVVKLVGEILGAPMAQMIESRPEIADGFRQQIERSLKQPASAGSPVARSERWVITDPYRGIEHARLVVINARGDAERARGERALENVQRLRKDRQVFADVFDWRGDRTPITAVVADLNDERDPGLKKALRRAKRALDPRRG